MDFRFDFWKISLEEWRKGRGEEKREVFLKLLNISLEIFEENREMERNFRDPREYIP